MNCPKCNYSNADNALFCASCGAKLEMPSVYSPVENQHPVDAAPVNNDVPAIPQTPVYGSQEPVTPQEPAAPQLPVYGAQEPSREGYPTYTNAPTQAPPAQSFPTYGQQPAQPQQPQYVNNTGAYQSQPPVGNTVSYNGVRPGQERDWAAVAALVCGILSLPCCFTVYGGLIVAAAAVVFGILGLKSAKKSMAIAGLVLGGVGLVCAIIMIAGVATVMKDPVTMQQYMDRILDL